MNANRIGGPPLICIHRNTGVSTKESTGQNIDKGTETQKTPVRIYIYIYIHYTLYTIYTLYSQEPSLHSQTPKMSIFCHIFFHVSALHEVRHLVTP